MVPTDQALIDRTRQGDNAAFGQLWERYEPRVRRLCQRMLHASNTDPAADAQDLTSETFIQALHALEQFRPVSGQEGGFGAWVLEIARRRCLKWLERQRRRATLLQAHTERPGPGSVAQQVEERSLLQRAAQEINSLPDNYRTPFRLMLEQYSHGEIAESLGLSVEAVSQRIHRARVQLRPRLGSLLGTPSPQHAPRRQLAAMEHALSAIVARSRIVTVQLPSGGELQLCVRVDARLMHQETTLTTQREALPRHRRAWKPYLAFAELCYHCGSWDEARETYLETLRRNPACLPAAIGLWQILRNQARPLDAVAALSEALCTHPSNALQALLFEAQGQHAEAVLAYERALTDHPQERRLYHGLNRTLGYLSRYQEQLAVLERLRGIAPDDLYGYDGAYTPAARLERWEELAPLMEKATQLDPNNPALLQHFFQVRMNQRLYDDETLALAERLVELAPDFVASWSELAWIYAERGRDEESLAVLQHFLEKHPNNAEGHAALAWRYHYQGRRAECLEHARRAYALAPTDWYVCWTILVALRAPGPLADERQAVADAIRTRFPEDRFIQDTLQGY